MYYILYKNIVKYHINKTNLTQALAQATRASEFCSRKGSRKELAQDLAQATRARLAQTSLAYIMCLRKELAQATRARTCANTLRKQARANTKRFTDLYNV